MIYTSYFENLNYLPKDILPISICLKVPSWYTGLRYQKLAPTYEILSKYKTDHDAKDYTIHYKAKILDKLSVQNVILDIINMIPDRSSKHNIALICYETPSEFCHRHLVADWLTSNGFKCEEYKNS